MRNLVLKVRIILLFIYCFCFTVKAQTEGVSVFSGVYIHSDAYVGVFVDLNNVEDSMVHLGNMSLIESSLNNKKQLTGSGTLKITSRGYAQDLYGGAPIYLDTLILDNLSIDGVGFDCDIYIDKACDFRNGILEDFEYKDDVDPETLHFVEFSENSMVKNVRNASHISGVVKKIGSTAFCFPIGDRGYYRPAMISSTEDTHIHTAKYYYNMNPLEDGAIPSDCFIQREEYWYLSCLDDICNFALSYSNETSQFDCDDFVVNVASYDGFLNKDMKLISSKEDSHLDPTFRYFWGTNNNSDNKSTLLEDRYRWFGFGGLHATVSKEWPQIVTPNNDGYNDQFIVPNLDYYRNNKIQIFNRYGNLVYETANYDNSWKGETSVKIVSTTSDDLLPSATYFVFFYNDNKLIYKDYIELVHNR